MRYTLRVRHVVVVVLLGIALVVVVTRVLSRPVTLELMLRDSVSSAWVWDATVSIQDRVIRSYFQSDSPPRPLRFTGLQPGSAELTVRAPSYQSVTVPVTLSRGHNVLEEPVELSGYEIRDLTRFVIFPIQEGAEFRLEIRPVGSDNRAIVNHPALPIWIGARVSVQESGIGAATGALRGDEVFRGELAWSFDPDPNVTFRYRARIPLSAIPARPGESYVFDYLVLVPDTRVSDTAELATALDGLMGEVAIFSDIDNLRAALHRAGIAAQPYFFTSWNVEVAR